jgi:hypothetical protein
LWNKELGFPTAFFPCLISYQARFYKLWSFFLGINCFELGIGQKNGILEIDSCAVWSDRSKSRPFSSFELWANDIFQDFCERWVWTLPGLWQLKTQLWKREKSRAKREKIRLTARTRFRTFNLASRFHLLFHLSRWHLACKFLSWRLTENSLWTAFQKLPLS